MWLCPKCGLENASNNENCAVCQEIKPTKPVCALCGTLNEFGSEACSLCESPLVVTYSDIQKIEDASFVKLASTFAEELTILDSIMEGGSADSLPRKSMERPWLVDGTEAPLEPDDAYHIIAWVQKQRSLAKRLSEQGDHLLASVVLRSILSRMRQRFNDLIEAEPERSPKLFDDVKRGWYLAKAHHIETKTMRAIEEIEILAESDTLRGNWDEAEVKVDVAAIKARKLLRELQTIATEGELRSVLERCQSIAQRINETQRRTESRLKEIAEEDADFLKEAVTLLKVLKNPDGKLGFVRSQELRVTIDRISELLEERGFHNLADELREGVEHARAELGSLEEARKVLDIPDLDIEE